MDINNRQVYVFFNPDNDDYLVTTNISTGIIKPQLFPDLELIIEQLFSW